MLVNNEIKAKGRKQKFYASRSLNMQIIFHDCYHWLQIHSCCYCVPSCLRTLEELQIENEQYKQRKRVWNNMLSVNIRNSRWNII